MIRHTRVRKHPSIAKRIPAAERGTGRAAHIISLFSSFIRCATWKSSLRPQRPQFAGATVREMGDDKAARTVSAKSWA
eukprot:5744525-Pleurochrysis_carterae.AAC.1